MNGKNKTAFLIGWLLALAAPIATSVTKTASAAPHALSPVAASDNASSNAARSQVVPVTLPAGAERTDSGKDLAVFNDALQKVARENHGAISQTEALMWTGDAAKNALYDLCERMKAAGYTFAPMTGFDSEQGRVTPIAAIHGDKTDTVIGLSIETKEGQSLLVWGRFNTETEEKTVATTKPVTAKSASAAPRQTVAKPKRVATVTPRQAPPARRRKLRTETAAERQARAVKAYQDYQYVKMMGPISGPMYRSTKW